MCIQNSCFCKIRAARGIKDWERRDLFFISKPGDLFANFARIANCFPCCSHCVIFSRDEERVTIFTELSFEFSWNSDFCLCCKFSREKDISRRRRWICNSHFMRFVKEMANSWFYLRLMFFFVIFGHEDEIILLVINTLPSRRSRRPTDKILRILSYATPRGGVPRRVGACGGMRLFH